MCDRRCSDSESTWSTGVRGSEGGVAVGRGGAGPLLEDVDPLNRKIRFLNTFSSYLFYFYFILTRKDLWHVHFQINV